MNSFKKSFIVLFFLLFVTLSACKRSGGSISPISGLVGKETGSKLTTPLPGWPNNPAPEPNDSYLHNITISLRASDANPNYLSFIDTRPAARLIWIEHLPGDFNNDGAVSRDDEDYVKDLINGGATHLRYNLSTLPSASALDSVSRNLGASLLGYRVYRSSADFKDFRLIGTVPRESARRIGNFTVYLSVDPDSPGEGTVLYHLEPYGSGTLPEGSTRFYNPYDIIYPSRFDEENHGRGQIDGFGRHFLKEEAIVKLSSDSNEDQLLETIFSKMDSVLVGRIGEEEIFQILPYEGGESAVNRFSKDPPSGLLNIGYNFMIPLINQEPAEANGSPVLQKAISKINNDPYRQFQWGLDSIFANQAWDITEGNGTIYGVIDTGLDVNHQDIAANVQPGGIYINNPPVGLVDQVGHGTHVSGTGISPVNGIGTVGLAPLNKVLMTKEGGFVGGNWYFTGAGLAQAVNYHVSNGSAVFNMSLGGFGPIGFAFEQALVNADNADVLPVAAAGNSNADAANFYPAAYPTVMSVGAINSANQRAPFSNYGASVDVSAPGVSVLASIPNNNYGAWSGTSMASPHACSLGSLVYTLNPNISDEQAFQLIKDNTTPIVTDRPLGTGKINAYQTLLNAQVFPVANANATPTQGDRPLTVSFSATGSYSPNGPIVLYEWDFNGDGIYDWSNPNTGDTIYIYNNYGTYNANLRITDNIGAQGVDSVIIRVNEPPVAVAQANPVEGPPPLVVYFDSSSSYDLDGRIALYEWDFEGDGTWDYSNPTTGNTVFAYNTSGIFNATLRVTDDVGSSDTDSVKITVFGWEISPIDAQRRGRYSSIAKNSQGVIGVAYYDEVAGDLLYAKYDGTSWTTEPVDGIGDVGQYASLAFDTNGNPAISYYEATNKFGQKTGFLKFAQHDGTDWKTETVDSGGDTGLYCSLAFDSSDQAQISYFYKKDGQLKLASYDDGTSSWVISVVDPADYGPLGHYTSIAIDSGDNKHISYYDQTHGVLKYAYVTQGGTTITNIDGGGGWESGLYSSISLKNDLPAIAYYERTSRSLKFASFDGSGWPKETVESGSDVGTFASLEYDADGIPAISYFDRSKGDLRFARKTPDGLYWARETIDMQGTVGHYCSLVFDSGNKAFVSYYDVTRGLLKIARML